MVMKLEEFKAGVDIYSADLARWPQELVKAALQLMAESPEAKRYFEQDLRLLEITQETVVSSPDLSALEDKIMMAVLAAAAETVSGENAVVPWRVSWLALPGSGLLVAAFLGFMVGLQSVQSDLLLDPVFYAEEQIIQSGSDFYDGGVF